MKQHFSLKTLCTIFLIFIFTTGTAAAGSKDAVSIALPVDPTTINILQSKIGIDIMLQYMHEGLMASNPKTGDLEPLVADSITIMPNGKDIKITVKKNHKFHTGEPLTAKDIQWTYEQAVTPENAHVLASSLEEIEEIEIIDDYTMVFHYYEPFAPWRETMWLGICSKNYFEKAGRKKFQTEPVGSGPFKFVSRTRSENVIMEANESYPYPENSNKLAYKTLKFLTVPDSITRLSLLETGEVDLIYGILPHEAKRIGINPKIKVKRCKDIPSYYGLSTKPFLYPIMADAKFHEALTHAINRQEIVDKVFLREGYPLYMYASRSELGYDPTRKIEFDLEKARKLIKESSYVPGDPIILTYTNLVPNSEIIAPIIQKYLRDVGVTVKLQRLEGGVSATYARTKDRRAGHMSLFSFTGGRDPHIRISLTIPSYSVYTSYPNRPNKEILDKLCIQQQRELNPKKRLAILKKIHDTLAKEPSGISLYGLNQIYAMRKRIDYTWTPKASIPLNLMSIKIMKEN